MRVVENQKAGERNDGGRGRHVRLVIEAFLARILLAFLPEGCCRHLYSPKKKTYRMRDKPTDIFILSVNLAKCAAGVEEKNHCKSKKATLAIRAIPYFYCACGKSCSYVIRHAVFARCATGDFASRFDSMSLRSNQKNSLNTNVN